VLDCRAFGGQGRSIRSRRDFASGIFFWGYFIFEVPSNVILESVGARLWIARIMITWGIIAGLTAIVTGTVSFSIARFLLGASRRPRHRERARHHRSSAHDHEFVSDHGSSGTFHECRKSAAGSNSPVALA
jgi:hypothetical protein